MTRILWCGGSHLAHAKPVLERQLGAREFFVTAGPELNRWSANGGRYRVDGSRVGGSPFDPDRTVDLGDYDRIVFIGQWIQPQKWFNAGQLLSTSVLERMCSGDGLVHQPQDGTFNEPLLLFPQLAPQRCMLACDPFPHRNSVWPERNCRGFYRDIPTAYLGRFVEHVLAFCHQQGMTALLQPDDTHSDWITDPIHSRGDQIHMTDQFWERYVELIGKSLRTTD